MYLSEDTGTPLKVTPTTFDTTGLVPRATISRYEEAGGKVKGWWGSAPPPVASGKGCVACGSMGGLAAAADEDDVDDGGGSE